MLDHFHAVALDRLPPIKRQRIELLNGSLMCREVRLAGFDAAAAENARDRHAEEAAGGVRVVIHVLPQCEAVSGRSAVVADQAHRIDIEEHGGCAELVSGLGVKVRMAEIQFEGLHFVGMPVQQPAEVCGRWSGRGDAQQRRVIVDCRLSMSNQNRDPSGSGHPSPIIQRQEIGRSRGIRPAILRQSTIVNRQYQGR